MAIDPLVIAGLNLTCVLGSLAEYQVPEKDCLLPLLAKGLGYGIIVGSSILKLPQILIILRSRSIEGLSVPSFEIECLGYTISVGYCLFKQVPFTAYGELFFLLLQSLILMVLIYSMQPQHGSATWIKVGIYSAILPVLFSGKLDGTLYEALYNGQSLLFNIGRIPQMWINFTNKSTGQLSLFTTFLTFGGCIARLFTSIQEKAPISMAIGSILGMLSHGTILSQIVYYTYVSKKKTNGGDDDKDSGPETQEMSAKGKPGKVNEKRAKREK
eukprot:TRINITY_DN11457_c0_g2_i2.p1 TRINITY_DN11457_c0_g2~~TRINITY_DN11457_c0_g2_i2.p1  ORF type:complete len:271 (-),score=45.71 TRINITY_DN11457_c0_g2_i2:173-985(-)